MANFLESYGGRGRGGLFDLIREFDNWFDASGSGAILNPNFDVDEFEDRYSLVIDMPGVRPEDVRIEARGNQMLIQAERKTDTEREGTRRRSSVSYQRVFTLPESIDPNQIQAALENGVLEIQVPKTTETASRRIQVGSTRTQLAGQTAGQQGKAKEKEGAKAQSQAQPQQERSRH